MRQKKVNFAPFMSYKAFTKKTYVCLSSSVFLAFRIEFDPHNTMPIPLNLFPHPIHNTYKQPLIHTLQIFHIKESLCII